MTNSSLFKILFIIISAYLLTACAGLGGLSHKQIKVLQSNGFSYTDEGWLLNMPSSLLFETNQFELQESQTKSLADLSQNLLKVKLDGMMVQGHTDNVGDPTYNQQLSEKRAQSVTYILTQTGFKPEKVKTVGYGASKPLAENDSEDTRSKNRRVALVVMP